MGFRRGGKIVATTGGVALAVAPLATLAAAAVWVTAFLLTRYTSVASLVSAATLPLFAVLFGASWPVVAFAAGAAVAIFVLHRANIARLLSRSENRFELRRTSKGPAAGSSSSGARSPSQLRGRPGPETCPGTRSPGHVRGPGRRTWLGTRSPGPGRSTPADEVDRDRDGPARSNFSRS